MHFFFNLKQDLVEKKGVVIGSCICSVFSFLIFAIYFFLFRKNVAANVKLAKSRYIALFFGQNQIYSFC